MKNIPRIVIAGTQSGVGKTSVSLAVMAAFKKSGLRVQPFKVGPDYIDPGYHKEATGFPSHNLDGWLCSKESVQWLFQSKSESADLAIIEGVMGLYDGFGGKEETGSTAQIAKWLQAPVLLVLDVRSLSRSVAAIVKGYQLFDPEIKLAGVILNRVGSARHLEYLREAIDHYTGVPVLGAIFRDEKIKIPERHLGLTTASENNELAGCLDRLSELSKKNVETESLGIDLEKIIKIAKDAPSFVSNGSGPVTQKNKSQVTSRESRPRIAFAQDRAFSFYYQANLDLLIELGAELVPFSPLEDKKIPEGCGALYFGGGFPEVYAGELAENRPLKSEIQKSLVSGMPAYAECGGLMYLSESIETLDGKSHAMVGSVPGKIVMTQKLQNFGYKEGKMIEETILGSKGTQVRGHEFHYSKRERIPVINSSPFMGESVSEGRVPYELTDRKSGKKQLEGYAKKSLLASYLHLHFLSNPVWAKNFVQAAKRYSDQSSVVSSQ